MEKEKTGRRSRVRRSGLIMPVDVPQFIERAWTRDSDGITLDLEDAVAPNRKSYARTLVKEAIPKAAAGGSEVGVRVNHDTPEEDCEASIWPGLSFIAYPKTESGDEIRELEKTIAELESARGIPPGTVEINAMIETAIGVWNAYEIASASPRISSFGGVAGGDLTADLGLQMEADLDVLGFCRGLADLVARATGKQPTAGVWSPGQPFGYADQEGLLRREEVKRRAGYRSGGGIHPAQVTAANAGLTPDAGEVSLAQRIVSAVEEAWEAGEAYAIVDGYLIDREVADASRDLIAFAHECQSRDETKRALREAIMQQKETK